MRHHTFRITWAQWQNLELRNSLIKQARYHAGRNPGMYVWIKREVYGSKPKRFEVIKEYINRSGEVRDWS